MSRRFRHHTNPLLYKHSLLRVRSEPPYFVDVGCGRGDFLIEMATKNQNNNFYGIEVRPAIVEELKDRIEKLGLKNLNILHANASENVLNAFGKDNIEEMYIFFPDPWFKPKYKKRDLFSEKFINDIFEALPLNGRIYFQTDQKEVFDNALLKLLTKFEKADIPFVTVSCHWRKLKKGSEIYSCVLKKRRQD